MCALHGTRADAHSPTAASATSASDAMGIIGQCGAECRLPGIALLSVELAKYCACMLVCQSRVVLILIGHENITVLCGGGMA